MPVLVPVIVAIPFAFVAWLIHRILEHKVQMRQLAAPRPPPALPPASEETARRLANLEAIVASLDYDFAERMRPHTDGRAA